MNCVKCQVRVKCMYTREGVNGRIRRYVCSRCGVRFTTLEQRADQTGNALVVIPDAVRAKIYDALADIERALGP